MEKGAQRAERKERRQRTVLPCRHSQSLSPTSWWHTPPSRLQSSILGSIMVACQHAIRERGISTDSQACLDSPCRLHWHTGHAPSCAHDTNQNCGTVGSGYHRYSGLHSRAQTYPRRPCSLSPTPDQRAQCRPPRGQSSPSGSDDRCSTCFQSQRRNSPSRTFPTTRLRPKHLRHRVLAGARGHGRYHVNFKGRETHARIPGDTSACSQ
jgi:hypothetical protein